ncbi:MAG: trigger factor [Candidatus Bipolaricaulota bacterium]|nr:trigger factor [Candidatus Bipolaricaulota bacterium]MCS7274518.1 trigger factor [Candidatus Bipolaricaulota bacterium]MDW8111085.1 trigger factor [Candidatus Bipolaricaulota bacterium]MDW8329085.1 trigger factor [Candidatus Bipolaricaulota bacterium]
MKASKEIKSATQVTVKVEVPVESVKRKLEDLYRRVGREIQLPGFRRGHIPRAVLEARFGKDFLYEDAKSELIEEHLPQALRELGLRTVGTPQIKSLSFSEESDFVFEADVETLPEVTVRDYTEIPVEPVEVPPVTEADIDEVVERLRYEHATLVPKEGANALVVEEGDVVEVLLPGEERPREWQVSQGDPSEALLGHRVGQRVTLALSEEQKIPVQIESVKRLEKPSDEELAQRVGQENFQALRAKIRQDLEEARARRRDRELKLRLLDKLVERTPIELPTRFLEDLVAQELEQRQQRGLPELSADDVKQLKTVLEQRVRRQLVLEALKKQEHLALSEQEFAKLLEAEAQKRQLPPIKFRALLEREGQLERYRSELEEERVLQFLFERAVIKSSVDPSARSE